MNFENLKIGIHQINTITGDIKGNLEKIKSELLNDKNQNSDISIFPETAITGYMCGSLWDRTDFVDKQNESTYLLQEFITAIEYNGTVIIGFVDFLGLKSNGFPHLKNAAAIISKDYFGIYHKQLLASADHHEDLKYFSKGDETKVFSLSLPNVGNIRIGILICEDAWTNDHISNIPSEMVKIYGADLLININQSYFYYGKQEKRIEQFSKISKIHDVPFITVNSCSVGDILKNIVIFDGGSMIFDKGNLLFEAPRFKEHNEVISFNLLKPIDHKIVNKYEEITNALIFEQKEFFDLMSIKRAQVHVSGGIDSAVVAALVIKAMGKDNTVLITNPSVLNTKSLKYVIHLEKKLDVILSNPIQSIFEEFMKVHSGSFCGLKLSNIGQATVQATLRTVQGLAASHQFNSGIVATGNHTEIVLGWASFHDIGSIGVHALIGDLTKIEVFQLSQYLNSLYCDEIIPEDLFNGNFRPAAELPDANEDPIDYYVQSGICALLIRERKCKEEIMYEFDSKSNKTFNEDLFPDQHYLWSFTYEQFEKEVDFAIEKMKKSVYKAAQGAPIVIISPRSRGFSNRETLINFYN